MQRVNPVLFSIAYCLGSKLGAVEMATAGDDGAIGITGQKLQRESICRAFVRVLCVSINFLINHATAVCDVTEGYVGKFMG